MKRLLYLLALSLVLAACDHIADDDRLIYVKPASVKRTVLIEDFTGQRCVNCPKATEVIHQLEEQYPDGVIAVGIHSGPFARSMTGTRYALGTDEGDEYYSHWRLDRQPVGMVNRLRVSDYTEWTAIVHEQVQLTAPLSIAVSAEIDPTTRQLTMHTSMMGTDGQVQGNLQLWLVEDSIEAFQYLPDNTVNREYIHNHVLRCAINGTWGEPLTLAEGEQKEVGHQLALKEAWNADNLRVVAFVYNDKGVLQAAQAKAALIEIETE